ncbi:MAG: choline dehydrogenase [Gammaproteobacteria bacterium]|nr:MAG: choline dehydrogenase [Gammaproteobacteria bacterium]
MAQAYDYIIIGAGSAGCVLANRLSEDPNTSVLVLEYGGSDRSIFIQMPTALSIPMNMPKFNWGYESQPEPYLDNRRMNCPRGKVLGGSSSINGMVYVRGHAMDYDQWEEQGAKDWGYRHCLPYFKKAEDWAFGSDDYRSQQGPLSVNNGNNMQNPLYRAFIEAGAQAGYMKTDDYNGRQQEGFGRMHMTVKNGVRWSTANAYLKPALQRPNLRVITNALTRQILLEGKKSVGVEFEQAGRVQTVQANREVLLSAGPIASPQLLQVSGIGPADVLNEAGIAVKHELPGVGQNLQDHLELYFQFRCKQPITLNGKLDLWSKFLIGLRWILTKKGLGATNHFESCGFVRSRAGVKWPDIQFHFLPAAMRYDGNAAFDGHGFQVHVGHNKPQSRGTIRAQSPNIKDKPKIIFNYLQQQEDIEAFRACVRLTREIIAQKAMDPYRDSEIQPGEAIQSDEEIDAFVRGAVESAYHPSCACRMGEDDGAVVDSKTRVHGIDNLRVVDSSIFPVILNGNLNSPTIMLAERTADIIKGKGMLEPSDAAVALAEDWEIKQRSTSAI